MTNCYICGHPILNGQKSRREMKDMWGSEEDPYHFTHLNPADHLPTDIELQHRSQEWYAAVLKAIPAGFVEPD